MGRNRDDSHEQHTRGQHGIVQAEYTRLQQLPRHGWWTLKAADYEDVDGMRALLERCVDNGLVQKGEKLRLLDTQGGGEAVLHLYATTETLREMLDDYQPPSDSPQLPCGHYGFSNSADSEFIECTSCIAKYKADELREYL